MKKLISVFLALTLVLGLAMVASAATPGDNGWWDDDGEFDGWTVNDDGSFTMVNGDGTGKSNNRIGHGIDTPDDFEITVHVDTETGSRPTIKLFGVVIELNAENGHDNQIFLKYFDGRDWKHNDWHDATGRDITMKIVRANGGNLQITLTGKDNANPVVWDIPVAEADGNNIELGMYGCGENNASGRATYTVTLPAAPVIPEPPVDDNPTTGDIAGIVVAMMAVSGAALVVLKKKEI